MIRQLRPALAALFAFTLITGVVYPLVVTALAGTLFRWRAHGSLIRGGDGKIIGSELIGRQFDDPKHFWPRPSATPDAPYNASSSSGANLGPLNPRLKSARDERAAKLRSADPGNLLPIPPDLLAASASGLDPHISPAAARYQAARVARARGWPVERVQALIEAAIENPQLGFLGEPRVNVLRLNLALDNGK